MARPDLLEKGNYFISSPKRVSFQEVSVAHMELRDAMKILRCGPKLRGACNTQVLRCSGIVAVLPLKLLGAEEFCVKILRPAPNGPVIVGSTGKMEDVHEI